MSIDWFNKLFRPDVVKQQQEEEERKRQEELDRISEEKAARKFEQFAQSPDFDELIRNKAKEFVENTKREKEEEEKRREREYEEKVKKAEDDISLLREKMKDSSEPWVHIISSKFDPSNGIKINLDWNDSFIRYLRKQGIKGENDEEVVKIWLAFLSQDIDKLMTAENYLHSETAPSDRFDGDIDDLIFEQEENDEKDDFARWEQHHTSNIPRE